MTVTALKAARWGGIFSRADGASEEPSADVATLPRDLNKLVARIKSTQERLAAVEDERANILDQWRQAEVEKDAVLEANAARRNTVQGHLTQLQAQMADIVQECGLQVVAPPGGSDA
jgi:chromosome segregation ATPase